MRYALLLPLALLVGSCSRTKEDAHAFAHDLDVITNWKGGVGSETDSGAITIDLDYTDAWNGFTIPSERQVSGGTFSFRFHAMDPTGKGRPMCYKLFWRNESSMQPETATDGTQHPFAHENFYGSWCDGKEGLHTTDATGADGVEVTDAFRIMGDPRDEPIFRVDGVRHREGRNPRTGTYTFLLVAMPAEHATQLPQAVQDVRVAEADHYVEPYWYFLHGPGSKDPDVQVLRSERKLLVRARPPLAGIFSKEYDFMPHDHVCATCGDDSSLARSAAFEQFEHHIDPSTGLDNIPLVSDILGNAFTPTDHDRYRAFFPQKAMVHIWPTTYRAPCQTVRYDDTTASIELRNPASRNGDPRKENVGVRTRHALTYGKYRVHCQLTRLLNDSDMWNGLTNAIWLLGDSTPWSLRRNCEGGYLQNYYGGSEDPRVVQGQYAEIDFEILKTPPYCPKRTFPPVYPEPIADPNDRDAWVRQLPDDRTGSRGMISVACTNWDMACPAPPLFAQGCQAIQYEGEEFWSHRWDLNYRAVTQKVERLDKELFGAPFWFEIEWRPNEIIWRIGPDADHMQVVGYMNDSMTSIPDVPMRLLITQEFHNTRWWPGSPYEQGYIPFPGKDYVGRVLEIVIE